MVESGLHFQWVCTVMPALGFPLCTSLLDMLYLVAGLVLMVEVNDASLFMFGSMFHKF